VVGLAWSKDPASYAGGSLPTGRVSHAGQFKGDGSDEKRYPGPAGWGLGVRPTSPRKKVYVEKTSKIPGNELTNRRRSGYKRIEDTS